MTVQEFVSRAWRDLARHHECDAVSVERVLQILVRAYSEPHRHYHTLSHIADLLHLLGQHDGIADSDAVTLAILFHDAIYDPARQDNELASANLAREQLTLPGFPDRLIAKVERYILATQHGASLSTEGDADLQMLLDLDLSVLAATPDRYDAYAQAIRHEYAAVPDELYRPGRRRVLEGFLARPQIYRTEQLRALWEAPARANLSGEIAALA